MKVAIFGATGQTGAELVQQALAAGDDVVAPVRNPSAFTISHAKLVTIQADATKSDEVAKAIAGVDAVIVAIGPPSLGATTLRTDAAKAIVSAMTGSGVKRIVWLSAAGVGDSAEQMRKSSFLASMFIKLFLKKTYADALGAEDVLRASGLEYVLVRPPGLTNKKARGESRFIEDGAKISRVQIPRADVATFMLSCVRDDKHVRKAPIVC
jgi:putative NADH-flavin reductase